jgi:type I restriction enzyme, S subunit
VNIRLAPIGDFVEPIRTWNPTITPGNTFNYVDLSAVDQIDKQIKFAVPVRGSEAPSRARQLISKGDILVSTVRPNLNGVAPVTDAFDGATASTGFCVLRPRSEKLASNYLMHWVRSPQFIDHMVREATGASYPAVSDRIIKASHIPLPPIEEQRRIAAILDKADTLCRKRKRALDLLESLNQSIFLEMFGEASENPRGFPSCKLGDLCEFRGGSQPPKSTFSYEPGPEKIRLIQIRDYKTDEYATYIPKDLARRPCSKSDVMIGRYGPPLFQILKGLEGSYNVALIKADPRLKISRAFLFCLLSSPKLQADVISQSERSAGQTGVNLKFLNAYPAYFPPERLQVVFEKIANRQESVRAQSNMAMLLADEVFSSLQSRAFSGQL